METLSQLDSSQEDMTYSDKNREWRPQMSQTLNSARQGNINSLTCLGQSAPVSQQANVCHDPNCYSNQRQSPDNAVTSNFNGFDTQSTIHYGNDHVVNCSVLTRINPKNNIHTGLPDTRFPPPKISIPGHVVQKPINNSNCNRSHLN